MLHLYRSNDTARLAAELARLVAEPPRGAPLLAREPIVIPSPGMERWLEQQLAERLGIASGYKFYFPGHFIEELFTSVLGDQAAGLTTFSTRGLTWCVLAALADAPGDAELTELGTYLGVPHTDSPQPRAHDRRAFDLARRIADTFDHYLTHRPELIAHWEEGHGEGWQASLWRRIKGAATSRGARGHIAFLAGLFRARLGDPATRPLPALPHRLCCFGLTTLPPFHLDVLRLVAEHVDVHYFLPSPSPQTWQALAGHRAALRDARRARGYLLPGDVPAVPAHPLAASLGRLAVDFQANLESLATYDEPRGDSLFARPGDRSHTTLLGRLQAEIQGGAAAGPTAALDPNDRSIVALAAHGPMRQVEALQDELLAAFAELPGLEARDILVMTPDVEGFAPRFQAVFDLPPSDARFIPYRLSDRTLRGNLPVADALLALVDLALERTTATRLLDLLAQPPVRRRFGLPEDEFDTIVAWVRAAGVRWGVDETERAAQALPSDPAGTWRFGLERLLLGLAMPDDGHTLFDGVRPCVAGGENSQLLGRFIGACDTLFGVLAELRRGARVASRWRATLLEALRSLCAAEGEDEWHVRQVVAALADLGQSESDARLADAAGVLDLGAVRGLLEERLTASGSPGGFLSGAMTVAAMVPMRNVPFRVIAILGLDHGVFPRADRRPSFDLMASEPRPGDRTPREDDRTLFLETILAVRDRLILGYTGQSLSTGETMPPSVVVDELFDALGRLAPAAAGAADDFLATRVRTVVPLEPHSPVLFGAPDAKGRVRPPSFAASYLPAARARLKPPVPPPAFLAAPLVRTPVKRLVVIAEDLIRFFEEPVAVFMINQLGLEVLRHEQELETEDEIEIDSLGGFGIGQELVTRLVDGDLAAALRAKQTPEQLLAQATRGLVAGGLLRPGVLGRAQLRRGIFAGAVAMAEEIHATRTIAQVDHARIEFALGGGRWQIRGDLPHRGGVQVMWRFSQPRGKLLIRAWLSHLMLCAARGHHASRTLLVCRPLAAANKDGRLVERVEFAPLSRTQAEEWLAQLVGIYELGASEPIVAFPDASLAFVKEELQSSSESAALHEARTAYDSDRGGASRQPLVKRLLREWRPGEPLPWTGRAPSFAELARTIYVPLERTCTPPAEPVHA